MIVAIGYLASAVLAYSLVVTNVLKFRWLNLTGCLFFIIYGLLISAFPVILANTILFGINFYQLVKLYISKESFKLLPFEKEGALLTEFLEFYKKDIDLYFPDFSFGSQAHKISFVVLRDLVVANLFVATLSAEGNAVVEINYTVANYRDYKIGRFIFEKEKEFLVSKGVKNIVYEKMTNKNHLRFLKVMGFANELSNGKNVLVKRLT